MYNHIKAIRTLAGTGIDEIRLISDLLFSGLFRGCFASGPFCIGDVRNQGRFVNESEIARIHLKLRSLYTVYSTVYRKISPIVNIHNNPH